MRRVAFFGGKACSDAGLPPFGSLFYLLVDLFFDLFLGAVYLFLGLFKRLLGFLEFSQS